MVEGTQGELRSPEEEAAAQEAAIDSMPAGEKDLGSKKTGLMRAMREHPRLRNVVLTLAGVGATFGAMKTAGAESAPQDRGGTYSKFYGGPDARGKDDVISTVFDKALYKLKGEDKIQGALDIGSSLQYYQIKAESGDLSDDDKESLQDAIAKAKRFALDNGVPLGQLFDLRFAADAGVDAKGVPPTPPESKPKPPTLEGGDLSDEEVEALADDVLGPLPPKPTEEELAKRRELEELRRQARIKKMATKAVTKGLPDSLKSKPAGKISQADDAEDPTKKI